MAHTAHKDKELLIERFDEEEKIVKSAKEMANYIKESKHFIVFTGAGISTSAGIPDFRGPEGVWTLEAEGRIREDETVDCEKAIPTPTHMALVELMNKGFLKYIISQNCDGLHRKSGVHPDKISELHGNTNLETCIKCGKGYLRDYDASSPPENDVHDHRTGRNCDICGGELHDTIINFGENLPKTPLKRGFSNANKSDLCLVLGSSLTVTPASDMPKSVGKKDDGKLVICNLQKTSQDKISSLRIHAKCDDFMKLVMKELNLTIPPFILHRIVKIKINNDRTKVDISSVEVDGVPASIFKAIVIDKKAVEEEPFSFKLNPKANKKSANLYFIGNYNEPRLNITFQCDKLDQTWHIDFNPNTGEWKKNLVQD